MKRDKPLYRVIGAYDSETTNLVDKHGKRAFPVLHQLGLFDCNLLDVDAGNVEKLVKIELYRHAIDLYSRLDEIVATDYGFVPVICCHNLSFDMYGLSSWLMEHDNARVLAKSKRKPITFTIRDDNNKPRLVIWDTLVFSQKPLSKMGDECGYKKLVGDWDYNLIRTPDTPLTPNELEYAKHDIYALIAWLSYWLKKNPDIKPEKLGLNVVTKTGVVREKRKARFSNVRAKGAKYSLAKYWHYKNGQELPKTDDELYTLHASMRGGFTFVSSTNASRVFDFRGTDKRIYGYDATSQHPAQMVSHRVPKSFHATSIKALENAFQAVGVVTVDDMLQDFSKPFGCAFYAAYEFENLRPKQDSVFARFGVMPLASARFGARKFELDEENQDNQEFNKFLVEIGYQDTAANPRFEFGKLVSADMCILFITELTAWEIWQAYEWESVKCLGGYLSTRFDRPTDFSVVSVMQFYQAKNEFKKARESYYKTKTIDNVEKLLSLGFAESTVDEMEEGIASDTDVDFQYLNTKADLNALFGIEATNEFRRDTVITNAGIDYAGGFGLENAPKNPKAHYQYGMRIVGWSRIAQMLVMLLVEPYIDEIVNGDTDSIKFVTDARRAASVDDALMRYSDAIDKAKRGNCARVENNFPHLFDPLNKIGYYVREFESECFCASWNKAYCRYDIDPRDGERKYSFTIAGLPSKEVNDLANNLGLSFADTCNLLLGYNVNYTSSVIGLNARSFPEWGATFYDHVTDYTGNESLVIEPAALALYPTSKIVNSFESAENVINYQIASRNNPDVNADNVILFKDSGGRYGIVRL